MTNRIRLAVAAFALVGFACSVFVGGPAYPDPPVPVSPAAGESLQTAFDQALAGAATSGSLTVTLTESQLTSYLAARLQAQANPIITEPQVTLRDGAMTLYGKTDTGFLSANSAVTIRFSVDEAGAPQVQVTKALLGPLPAPAGLDDAISSMLAEALTGSIGPAAIGFRLQSITIAGGVMTLTGRTQ